MINFIEVNNVRYALTIHQQKKHLPSLLMMHGFMGCSRVFDHLIDDLCDFSNSITIDLLGHGKSTKTTEPERYHEKQQIDDIATVIRRLAVAPLFMHGYSMGGRLALKTALTNPELFRGLILESTNCGIVDPQERKQRRQTDHRRAEQISANFDRFLSHWQQLPLFESPNRVDEQLQKKYIAIQQSHSPEAMTASLRGFGTGNMQPCCDELNKLELPVLLMAGSSDKKYQQITHGLARKLPDSHFTSIKAGHRVHLDNPIEWTKEIEQYIAKVASHL